MFHGYVRMQNITCFPHWIKTCCKFSLALWLELTKWDSLTTLQAVITPPFLPGQRTIKPKRRKNTMLSSPQPMPREERAAASGMYKTEMTLWSLRAHAATSTSDRSEWLREAWPRCYSQNNADGSCSRGNYFQFSSKSMADMIVSSTLIS